MLARVSVPISSLCKLMTSVVVSAKLRHYTGPKNWRSLAETTVLKPSEMIQNS